MLLKNIRNQVVVTNSVTSPLTAGPLCLAISSAIRKLSVVESARAMAVFTISFCKEVLLSGKLDKSLEHARGYFAIMQFTFLRLSF